MLFLIAAVTSKVVKKNDGNLIRTKVKLTRIILKKQLHCNVRVVTKTLLATDDLCERPPWVKVSLQKP
jgi:hypothetical protein